MILRIIIRRPCKITLHNLIQQIRIHTLTEFPALLHKSLRLILNPLHSSLQPPVTGKKHPLLLQNQTIQSIHNLTPRPHLHIPVRFTALPEIIIIQLQITEKRKQLLLPLLLLKNRNSRHKPLNFRIPGKKHPRLNERIPRRLTPLQSRLLQKILRHILNIKITALISTPRKTLRRPILLHTLIKILLRNNHHRIQIRIRPLHPLSHRSPENKSDYLLPPPEHILQYFQRLFMMLIHNPFSLPIHIIPPVPRAPPTLPTINDTHPTYNISLPILKNLKKSPLFSLPHNSLFSPSIHNPPG